MCSTSHVAPSREFTYSASADTGAIGLSQAQLADRAKVSLRQLARYEAGEQQPVLSAAVALADALGISLTQRAGQISYDLDLSGDWWAGWQTWKDGQPRVDTHTLEISQRGEVLQLLAERATPLAEGSYRWQGELRLWEIVQDLIDKNPAA